jgi:uncharacterized LabA/DUF88 family protein
MLKQYAHGRVAIFIDAANIFYSQQTLRWRVDYTKLKQYLERECRIVGLFFYSGKIGADDRQTRFLRKMEKLGYRVTTKEVKLIRVASGEVERKGDLDVELVIDALKFVDNFDTSVLLSGDSDFAPLLDELKRRGKRVIVVSTRGHISKELLNRAKYLDLRKLRQELEYSQ